MCMYDGMEYDPPTVSTTTTLRARKEHKCIECRRTIRPGEQYQRVFQVYDGHVGTYKTCTHCLIGQQWLVENCGGYVFEGVWDDYAEHVREYPMLAPHLVRLLVSSRRKWERFDRRGLMAIPHVPPSLESVGLGE